ncbi:hypothetical protein LTR78_008432 [Recurvomyces mirabilis]|uniref:chitin deacetylase n=1 Tax=Recurvomyces mirabilis TaxID=574656 RepID=A0AAE0WHP8_9PEZI|nr:hypothetical protein LTR78_008432 [Recurvomyces mirabilis]KAK5155420.1 hypothetical protein LTS14_005681 [Recurvomyces mirabilis]
MPRNHAGPWPNGARAAVAFTIDNMGEAADINRNLWPRDQEIGSHYSVKEILPQFLALIQEKKIPATYFVESWNLSVYPTEIRELAEAGVEVAWHAWQHEAWNGLDEVEERRNFERSFGKEEGIEGFCAREGRGKGVVKGYRGFRPPGGVVHGDRTLKLCRDYGLQYISSAGEEAALVEVEGGKDSIVVLPFKWRTVDAYYYMDAFLGLRKMKGEADVGVQSPVTLAKSYIQEVEAAIEKGGYVSTLFHPFLTNEPDRLKAMEMVMDFMIRKRDAGEIWLARCCDIAEYIRAHPDVVGDDPKWDYSSWR